MRQEEPEYRTPQGWMNVVAYSSFTFCVFLSVTQHWWTGLAAFPVCLFFGVLACRVVRL